MSSINDPVARRTMFYERRNRDNVETMRFYPFYLTCVSGAETGKMFEPVDCMPRELLGVRSAGTKTVHKIEEFNGRAKMFQCENDPSINLHSFGSWGWPLG